MPLPGPASQGACPTHDARRTMENRSIDNHGYTSGIVRVQQTRNKGEGTSTMTSETLTKELLTVSEVADILRVDATTVRRWVKLGTLEAVILPHVRTRQAYRIKRSTVDKLLDTTQATAVA